MSTVWRKSAQNSASCTTAVVSCIPNPWDVGSAVLLRSLGFKALASTSAGFAWSGGRTDYGLKREDVLQHLAMLSARPIFPSTPTTRTALPTAPRISRSA